MGSGFKSFTAGAVLTASDMNNYLMEQSVMYFATTAARDAALTAEDGMVVYIGSNDANEGLYTYNGTAWRKGPGWNAPWGHVSEVVLASTQTYANVTWGFPISWTGTPVANRRYRITIHADFVGGDTGQIQYAVGSANATPLRTFSTYSNSPAYPTTGSISMNFTTTGSSMTRGLTAVMATGSGNLQVGAGSVLTVDDIGPAGAPV